MRVVTEEHLHCPFCGEPISVLVDHSAGDQEYVEDCQVCCRPLVLEISLGSDGAAKVRARSEIE